MRLSVRSLLFSSAGCAVLFAVLLVGAYHTAHGRWLDNAALSGFLSTVDPSWWRPADAFARLCDPAPFALASMILIGVALARHAPRRAAAAGVVLVGAAATSQILKPLLAQARFDGAIVQAGPLDTRPIADGAFPSGHATAAMAIALAAVIVAPRALRPLVAAGGAVFALLIGFLIVALGWHFPSDVVGGYLVATAWCLAALAGLRAAEARWPDKGEIRAAARASAPRLRETLGPVAAITAALAVGVALARLDRLAAFADAHTTTTFVAIAMTVTATALVAAVSLADNRSG
jgi:membrane-associated phospholipid phosphatase